jgi:acyl dehydratase
MTTIPTITNKLYEDISIGDTASMQRTLTQRDIELFALISGDMNPAHLDEAYAEHDIFHHVIGHGLWSATMFSRLLGMELPGLGTIWLSQTLRFSRPVYVGDTITATVTVTEKHDEHKHIVLHTVCVNQNGEKVIDGEAKVIAATQRITRPIPSLSHIHITSDHKE